MKTLYSLKYKRRREGKTDYRKRFMLIESGKPRLVVRKSLNYVRAQIISYAPAGDIVLAHAGSKELEKYGWTLGKKNIPSAYLVGLLIAKKAKERGIKDAVLDVGIVNPSKGSAIYACARGAIDAGLNISAAKDLVQEERLSGRHIEEYVKLAKGVIFSKTADSYLGLLKHCDSYNLRNRIRHQFTYDMPDRI